MLFNSIEYLIFLPLVFLFYWFGCRGVRMRNAFIVVASFVFYGWWDLRFLGLMILSCLVSFLAGITMERFRFRKATLTASLLINFGILGFFKYFNFFSDNFAALLNGMGMNVHPLVLSIVLPVGISFYTFQAVGYTVDVYRRQLSPTRDPVLFFAFISFFPQLVAGPIERASNLIPQFQKDRTFHRSQATDGMRQILWGLMKKMLLADNCAKQAAYVFAHQASLPATDLWLGALFFTFQIYGDFSGYSDIAIGSGKLFGIRLMQNFRLPYFSQSIPEFWRRWHISLMSWLRDYLYFPLGGSRCSSARHWRNVLIVFLVSGLWHGANWTFVAWGAYHAVLFLPFAFLFKHDARTRVGRIGRTLLTFVLVLIGWVIFRSASLLEAVQYIGGMFTPSRFGASTCGREPLLFIALFVAAEALWHKREHPLALSGKGLLQYRATRYALYYLLFGITLWLGGEQMQFIYFQF